MVVQLQHGCRWHKEKVKLKNIAGNDVSIFLFQFELRGYGIDFVLNEAIAADMYPSVDEKIKPLVHACCETLSRYKHSLHQQRHYVRQFSCYRRI
jgi:hypothetical protein